MDKKIAIISSGGGMHCAFSAGCLCALAKKSTQNIKIIVPASGSTGSAFYFASRQFEEIERIWTKHLASKEFISFLRIWKILNIDFLVDTIFTEREPMDVEALQRSNIKIYSPLLNNRTKQVEFIGNDFENYPPHEVLRAAKAVPFLYGKKVEINDTKYSDGAFSISKQDQFKTASDHGATHFIIFDNSIPKTNLFKKIILNNNEEDVSIHRTSNTLTYKLETHNRAILSVDEKVLKSMFDIGYEAVSKDEELNQFLN